VERQTVYNHFPDELSLFKACSAHNRSLNPPPDPEPWKLIPDPEERLRSALTEVYAYYRRNEQMLANVTRDAQASPTVRTVLEPRIKHQERMARLLEGVGVPPARELLEQALRAGGSRLRLKGVRAHGRARRARQ